MVDSSKDARQDKNQNNNEKNLDTSEQSEPKANQNDNDSLTESVDSTATRDVASDASQSQDIPAEPNTIPEDETLSETIQKIQALKDAAAIDSDDQKGKQASLAADADDAADDDDDQITEEFASTIQDEEADGVSQTDAVDSVDRPAADLMEPSSIEEDEDFQDIFGKETDQEILNSMAGIYQIWWNWAHFELSVLSPTLDVFSPSVMIGPEYIHDSGDLEFVYPICDYGNRLSTSKGPEMYSAGMSMCKLYYTIEKMFFILIERLKTTGIDTNTEIRVEFDGHQLAQRKAFESVINLSYNVVVTNFDPGVWGEKYLGVVKYLADKGYGYPTQTPRDIYKNSKRASPSVKR